MTLFKEVTINFRTKTLGIFDVVTPVLEDGEIFNSGLLKDYINQMIASGRRSFSIDISPLDYIYSDTINVLMALNKRVLEISGRLTLLAPQPEVVAILQKAGIQNIMRVFDSEADLMRTSDEIMSMSSGYKVTDLQNASEALDKPESEFDSLRSEIGSVFGGDSQPSAPQQPPRQPSAPQQPQQSFDIYPMDEGKSGNQPPPPSQQQPPVPPKAPAYPPPVQDMDSGSVPPLPPKAPVQPIPEPNKSDFPGEKEPYIPSETRKFAQAPVQPSMPVDFDDLEGKPAASRETRDDFDTDSFDEEFEGKKKGFPVLALIAILVVAGLGAGGYFLYFAKSADTDKTVTATPEKSKPAPTVDKTSDSASKADEEQKESEEQKVESSKPKRVAKAKPKPKASSSSKSKPAPKPAPRVKKAAPKPAPAKKAASKKPSGKRQVVIKSTPSGADIVIDGSKMGTTPYTWTSPFYGQMKIVVSKPGYAKESKEIEYTGGTRDVAFNLKSAPAKKQAAASKPEPKPASKPEPSKPEPKPASKPEPKPA
ncbi:MAG: PEGA domain-containing protein, partial [Chitinispirillaceae bacterium]